jgi:hypothetical protein
LGCLRRPDAPGRAVFEELAGRLGDKRQSQRTIPQKKLEDGSTGSP